MFSIIKMAVKFMIAAAIRVQLRQQRTIVQELAIAPMQGMIQQVMSGIWVGRGADSFVEEVTSFFIPGANRICSNLDKFHDDIQSAEEIMERADNQIVTAVNGLAASFKAVY